MSSTETDSTVKDGTLRWTRRLMQEKSDNQSLDQPRAGDLKGHVDKALCWLSGETEDERRQTEDRDFGGGLFLSPTRLDRVKAVIGALLINMRLIDHS
ncbi:hypothetical protein D9C73_018056 [Collichthys lucidus]|uniref:Uncharacterized protein n=1 Tax=Collichthys lucidus TaxID=240159 RepID=A0A4U5V7P7_COLLU|nr:hypothetical protein D9C73_018056 [Collichthys lucidus]